jgi:hypothetical protein
MPNIGAPGMGEPQRQLSIAAARIAQPWREASYESVSGGWRKRGI